ncbi:hypothetical protein A3715_07460 [Oleiphilus sp. HI0009]|uniref:AraC family transcriptional regulator n=4 Tax=unclassified Oleiphilus TaxID=2631174 RepID=UPI0007C3DC2A|nr:AraC family transcriptional regulator [Oleiphilus sp. HI0066]KZX81361.1 hypothetical protein A3715_07460 [Oleiphilus sp. HI0009]KZY61930.1 hypothetical protein A3738_13405 [Oleiphilus sp. HI0066]MCH2159663.1 AraC family transcriptional regulator [Oleiphilaceae bacterium]
MKHLGFASIAALKQYLRYADAKRIDTVDLLADLKLTNNVEQSEEGRISGQQFQQFLTSLLHLSNDPIMGLSSALYVQSHSYNLLGALIEQSETLGQAISRIPLFERLVGDMGTTEIQRTESHLALVWHCNYTTSLIVPHMIDNVLASWTLFARWLTNSKASASGVYLTRPKPAHSIQQTYEQVFSAPVFFDQTSNRIELSNELLRIPLVSKQHSPKSSLEGKVRTSLSQLKFDGETLKDQILRSVKAHLQLGIASKELICQEFNTSTRHLQRQLDAEGTSYREILRKAREERATHFLLDTDLSVIDIAYNLGYKDERSFYRSFKKWTKVSPQEFRNLNR